MCRVNRRVWEERPPADEPVGHHPVVFPRNAEESDRAVIELRVAPIDGIKEIAQGDKVQVAGRVTPGAAVVVITAAGQLWPLYPATTRLRPMRLRPMA